MAAILYAPDALLQAADESSAAPLVPGFQRFYDAPDANAAAGGRLLLGELNCVACHQPESALRNQVVAKRGPVLTDVGARVKPAWMTRYLTAPHATKPGTTMPDLLGAFSPAERSDRVEALVHFLAATSERQPVDQSADRAAVQRGERLYHEIGCVACHDPLRKDATPLAGSVPLGELSAKYSIASLNKFLKTPTHIRPSGRMPGVALKDQELNDLSHYLLRSVAATPNFQYEYFEGSGDTIDQYFAKKPKATGRCYGLNLDVARRKDSYALRFTGFLRVIDKAEFTFRLTSDDGGRLTIDGVRVVDHDGIHGASEKAGVMILDRGMHRVVVEFFQGGGGAELSVEMETKDLARGDIAGAIALTADAEPPQVDSFVPQAALVARGREYFTSLGCANCHELKQADKPLASTLKSPAASQLSTKLDQGCLSTTAGSAPRYDLNPRQRAALQAALTAKWETPADVKVAQEQTITHTMEALNCYACHQRNGRGGPEPARDAYFVTTIKEMGDEGRLPPHLTGVGAKLRSEWLKDVLQKGVKDRPYMLTQMPQFNPTNVQPLLKAFEAVDTFEPLPLPTFDEPLYRVKDQGRHLAGGKAFSCIKCHTFGQYKAEGIQSIDMTAFSRRLRPEWFQRYVRDPLSYRPGTRMPAAWPKTGKSLLPIIYDGDSDRQIAAVWTYLLDGAKAAAPYGVGGQPIELKPVGEPLIYRNFIEGAGPRAIGVAYPEGVNLAWDANNLRLALIWKHAFIDASRHWTGRGQGFQSPLGDQVVPLVDGVPLARLTSLDTSWSKASARETDARFLGYRLDTARRPVFMYQCEQVTVEESYQPGGNDERRTLQRSLKLTATSAPAHLFFRAATGNKIEPLDDGWYSIDSAWKLRVTSTPAAAVVVRTSDGHRELLVPITWAKGSAQVDLVFDW